jgi:hypothetical protein
MLAGIVRRRPAFGRTMFAGGYSSEKSGCKCEMSRKFFTVNIVPVNSSL